MTIEVPPIESPATEQPAAAAKPAGEVSVLELLITLAERRHIVFRVMVLFAVAAIVYVLAVPTRYTATTLILPPQQNQTAATMLAAQLSGSASALASSSLVRNQNEVYVSMLRSETVEDAMVQRFDLMKEYRKKRLSDARKVLEKRTTVDGNDKDTLIHLSVEDHDPARAAEMANAYVDEFRKLSKHLAITEAAQRRLFFEQQLEETKNNLSAAEEALKETEQTTGMIAVDSQARALIESAAELRAQITTKEMQIQGMETYATGQNAQLVQSEQELDSLRAQLAQLGGSEDTAGGLIVPKGKVPEAGLEYARKLHDVSYYRTIFDLLARQFELAKLDEAKQGAVIQVVDPALPPDRRSFPKRILVVIGATAAGFFLGVILAFAMAIFERAKGDPVVSAQLSTLRRFITFKGLLNAQR